MATKKFVCKVCGYVHEGNAAPEKCPVCQAPASEFEEIKENGKKGVDTNSNVYTIVYASVVVIIVAFLLAFVSGALKDKQDENVSLDKKKQILSALNVDYAGKDVAQLYSEIVKADAIYNVEGEKLASEGGFNISVAEQNLKDIAERQLPVYECVDSLGNAAYVLPVRGAGLWGPIWGYVALNADKSTVYGVYFGHEGETPGLGAEIVKDKFKNPFHGKQICRDGAFTSVAVVKHGDVKTDRDYVDGVSGGTMTSDGVNKMLEEGLGQYAKFLNK